MSKPLDPHSVQAFYDALSDEYHFIYPDWHRAIQRQATVLHQIIEANREVGGGKTVLDCSCGIGTQAIGLAQLGYQIHGTDISAHSIQRARREAQKLNVDISFSTVDFRQLAEKVAGQYDVVISCDNALPHLLKQQEMLEVARQILSKLKPGGLFIGSIRDYDALLQRKPSSTQPVKSRRGAQQTITFQIWEWETEQIYQLNHFTLKEQDDGFDTVVRKTKYRAYQRQELTTIFIEAGFQDVSWLMPSASNFYQPLLLGKR